MPQLQESVCPYFGECGGCRYQDIPYSEQCELKSKKLSELFYPYWDKEIPVTPSPDIYHYRNKIDLNFDGKYYESPPPEGFKRETVLGFKRKGRWYHTLDIDTCLIAPQGTEKILKSVRQWMKQSNIPHYDSRSHQGFLKVLLIRQARYTGQRMIVLLTGPGTFDPKSFVEKLQDTCPSESIQWAITESRAGAAFAETSTVLYGNETIEEKLHITSDNETRTIWFRWSPFSFFQTNTRATEILYTKIRKWIKEKAPRQLFDLYGGSGGIALFCADLVEQIISVDSIHSATQDGLYNAHRNNIQNVKFITDKVKNFLKGLYNTPLAPGPDGMVIVDPPRAGLHPKALRRLLELNPPHILYVACKPTVLIRNELPQFLEQYYIERIEGVDLFPHTPHVETIVALSRK